jgi:hypothetical protein
MNTLSESRGHVPFAGISKRPRMSCQNRCGTKLFRITIANVEYTESKSPFVVVGNTLSIEYGESHSGLLSSVTNIIIVECFDHMCVPTDTRRETELYPRR